MSHAAPGWRLSLGVVLAAVFPSLLALAVFGVVSTPDSGGYLDFSAQLMAGLPRGPALLAEAPAPISLFRAPGYPLMLAALGPAGTIAVQVALQGALSLALLHLGLMLGLSRTPAALAAALPGWGFAVHQTVALLPDAIAAACVAGAAILLLRARRHVLAAGLVAGLLLALATTLREATPYLALFLIPLPLLVAGPWPRRLPAALLMLALPWAALAALGAWNTARAGTPVTTISRQVVLVQALLPMLKRSIVVHTGDDPYDRAARAVLRGDRYESIIELNRLLYLQGWATPVELSNLASDRYVRAWRTHPGAMLRATATRFRVEHLALAFDPGRTIGFMLNHTGQPDTLRLDRLAAHASGGDLSAGIALLAVGAARAAGLALGLLALAAPFLLWRRGDPRWRSAVALWALAAAPFAVYLPVHLEPRYLAPALPFVPLLAALAWQAGLAFRPTLGHTAPAGAPTPR